MKTPLRHANLTGLGAKDAKGAEDLGAWNSQIQASKSGRKAGSGNDGRPVRLEDYRKEEERKRQKREERDRDRGGESYRREREREREEERERRRGDR